jgi:RimJ/RimL family protein N-acetyltransferase
MLRGERIGLRTIAAEDLAVFDAEVHGDVELMMIAAGGPWLPPSLEREQARFGASHTDEPDRTRVTFAIEELATGELAGDAQLWGIDLHHRRAHLGYLLRPGFRGRGLGTDTIRTLCDYGFRVRGLHRLQIDTLASNTASVRAAESAGFTTEGQLRRHSWVGGEFADELILGQLAGEWTERGGR